MEELMKLIGKEMNVDEERALKLAYQTKQFVRSTGYSLGILAIITTLAAAAGYDLFFETLLVFLFLKLFRESMGGIHIKNQLNCFLISLGIVITTIALSQLPLSGLSVFSMLLFSLTVWFKYVPRGTEMRPFRNEKLKKTMRIKSLIYIVSLMVLYFIAPQYAIYGLWSLMITSVLILPVTYNLIGLKTDRI